MHKRLRRVSYNHYHTLPHTGVLPLKISSQHLKIIFSRNLLRYYFVILISYICTTVFKQNIY